MGDDEPASGTTNIGATSTTAARLAAAASANSSANSSAGSNTAATTTEGGETTITMDKPVQDDDTVPEDSEVVTQPIHMLPHDASPTTTTINTMANAASSSTNNNNTNNNKKTLNLRFLFANRDGLSVSIQCDPADTVGEVKGALISMWPKEMPVCSDGDDLRLICMGKGLLTPDSRTLADLEIPSFKSHATPVNVSVRRPEPLTKQQQLLAQQQQQQQSISLASGGGGSNNPNGSGALVTSLCCTIQ